MGVVELLDVLKIDQAHFRGLSLGGIVGQWLGIHMPERISRLILCHTSAYLRHYGGFDARIAAVLQPGSMPDVAETFLRNWFPAPRLAASGDVIQKFRTMLLETDSKGLLDATSRSAT